MSTVSLRPGLAFSCMSILYNNLRICCSRNTAKNKSEVICVLCCELVVVLSDGTILSASRRCFMTSRVVKSTVQRGPVCAVWSAATLQFCSFCPVNQRCKEVLCVLSGLQQPCSFARFAGARAVLVCAILARVSTPWVVRGLIATASGRPLIESSRDVAWQQCANSCLAAVCQQYGRNE